MTAPVPTVPQAAQSCPGLVDHVAIEGDQLVFSQVNCLLTDEELSGKCEEQFAVIWNGINREA